MNTPGRGRVRRRFALLLAALVLLVLAYPLADSLAPSLALNLSLRVLVLLATLYSLATHRGLRWLAVALCSVIVGTALWATRGAPAWAATLSLSCELVFYAIATASLARVVFQREVVRTDTLYGAACCYLLTAIAFGIGYELMEAAAPGSFDLTAVSSGPTAEAALVYFSVVTFTTLGFGDIVPLTEAARSIVLLQAVWGVLLPAVLISRLVSLHAAEAESVGFDRAPSSLLEDFSGARLQILFALLVLQLAAYPYFPLVVTRIVTVGVLLAALFALGPDRRRMGVGAALALLASIAFLWPQQDPSSVISLVGRASLAVYLVYATALLALDVLRRQEVGREVLFGAACVYLLLGITFASFYDLVGAVDPAAFSGSAAASGGSLTLEVLYFSFIVLTTTGYGDILPRAPEIQSLVVLQSFVGVLFPAVLVGRLVSLYR